jgi:hypothetical protein
VLDALAAGDSGVQAFPLVSILLYLGAVISGAWFIAPKALYAARTFRPDMNLLMIVAVVGRHRSWGVVRGRDGSVSLRPGFAPGVLERRTRPPGDQGVGRSLAAYGTLSRPGQSSGH